MTTAMRFDVETTRATLAAACDLARLDPTGATLIRMGENALYRLASVPVMARVGRSVDASRKELNVAAWLDAHPLPSARLADVRQPVSVTDMAVTFWEFIETVEPSATSAELGAVLRRLHDLPGPIAFSLPEFEPMPKVKERLAKLDGVLPSHDLEFLLARKSELDEKYASLDFPLPRGHIHGDAHRDNLLRDATTQKVRLIDFEDFAVGPREWDLCVEAIGYTAFGWITTVDYERYVAACGFDALRWSGFKVIRAIRELNMTTWLAQMWGHSEAANAEIARRVRDLRDEDAPREWSPF